MRGWQFSGPGNPLDLVELEEPTPRDGEVVVDVRAAGLCHSDAGFLAGVLQPVFTPIVLGHEVAGEICAVGPGVVDYSVGDRVAISAMGDGMHVAGLDSIGIGRNGGFADKVTAWPSELVRVPETVSFDQAAAATDAGMTAHHALVATGGLKAGMKVGIVGFGGLGSTAAQIAAALGAEVYVADFSSEVRAIAQGRKFAAVVETAADLAPFAPDIVVDFAGFGSTTAGAIEAVRPGGRVVQVGLGVAEATISTQLVTMKYLTLAGSFGGSPADTRAVVDLIAAGQVRVVTELIEFEGIREGLDRLGQGLVPAGRLVAVLEP